VRIVVDDEDRVPHGRVLIRFAALPPAPGTRRGGLLRAPFLAIREEI
jgi:hypothetical protein